jgi:transposase
VTHRRFQRSLARPGLRARLIELARSGRPPGETGPAVRAVRPDNPELAPPADGDDGRRDDGLTTEEREEVRQLRRANKTLREERGILKKAAAWFARANLIG